MYVYEMPSSYGETQHLLQSYKTLKIILLKKKTFTLKIGCRFSL